MGAEPVTSVHQIATMMLLGSLCACAKPSLENIPLVWKPTSETHFGAVNLTEIGDTKIQFENFRDVRSRPELIAENREDALPKPVTTHDNVGEFVSAHMRQILSDTGLNVVDSNADVIVSGEVRQFFVAETSTYQGTVQLRLTARNRAGGRLWSGTTSGSAKRFGRSYSKENYYEVLSDSTIDATATLLRDAEFRRALTRR
jgi:hypothetical protein